MKETHKYSNLDEILHRYIHMYNTAFHINNETKVFLMEFSDLDHFSDIKLHISE